LSHIVTIKTEVRDAAAVRSACSRLSLGEPVQGKTKLFTSEVAGLAVKLPEWQYPVVCELSTGQVRYDNFHGRWGKQEELDRFLQAYAVEKAKIEVRRKGHTVSEARLPDGSIKLTVQVNGGAA
jgi:hypothetical protein